MLSKKSYLINKLLDILQFSEQLEELGRDFVGRHLNGFCLPYRSRAVADCTTVGRDPGQEAFIYETLYLMF